MVATYETEWTRTAEAPASPDDRRRSRARRSDAVALPLPRFLPPLPEDVGDFFAPGDSGHEQVEKNALTPLIGDANRVKAIYFGNWQRDVSQVMAPAYVDAIGAARASRLCELLLVLLTIEADARFGRPLDRHRLGTYRWEEHVDNPRGFGIALSSSNFTYVPFPPRLIEQPEIPWPLPDKSAPRSVELWQEDSRSGLPKYLLVSHEYVLTQLHKASSLGPRSANPNDRLLGLEHFGNAMHTVEDFFSHSNFLELGQQNLLKRGDPMTGHFDGEAGQPLRDSKKRFRLTTGVYLIEDTVVSANNLLLGKLETPSGADANSLRRRRRRALINYLRPNLIPTYDDLMRRLDQTHIPALMDSIDQLVEKLITHPLNLAIAEFISPLVDYSKQFAGKDVFIDGVTGRKIVEMSHSHLSKDSRSSPKNPIVRALAVAAVQDFWREMERVWARPSPPDLTGTNFRALVNRYMNHPLADATGGWWRPIIGSGSGGGGGVVPPTPPLPPPPGPGPRPPTPVRPPSPPGPGGRPMLRRGSRGPAVIDLQRRLNVWLARQPGRTRLAVDGIFGAATLAAVQRFQRANRLAVDGIVGPKTWARLLRR